MKNVQFVQLEPRSTPWAMYRAMVGLGLLCAVVIVSVFQYTAPLIQQNKRELLEQSIYQLFPAARRIVQFNYDTSSQTEALFKLQASISDAGEIFACYDLQRKLMGFVVKSQGMGYQDRIVLIYAYLPESQLVTGFKVLESRETPGLGTRTESDPAFLRNFSALDVTLSNSQNELQHPIEIVKPGLKQHPWQIDSISGATISSRAIGNIMQQSTAYWIPQLKRHIESFRHATE